MRLGQFVTASLGQTAMNDTTSGGGLILEAMEAVSNGTKYPEFKGNVATVYTHPLEHTPGSSGGHYGKDAQTYMNVGEAMGQAMVGLGGLQRVKVGRYKRLGPVARRCESRHLCNDFQTLP